MRLCIPHFLTLAFVLLNVAAMSLPFSQMMKPDFVLVAVFYWAIFRPTLMPPVVTFGLGILVDVLAGVPAGFHALTYVTVHWIIRGQRRFLMGQPYLTVWLGYVFVCAAVSLLQWGVMAVLHLEIPAVLPMVLKTFTGIFVFPPLVLVLLLVHRLLPETKKAAFP